MSEKSKEEIEESVNIIKTWLETQKHLPEMMDDVRIANFLRLNKFLIEKTKIKIDMYYTIRSKMPDWFNNANPQLPQLQMAINTTSWAPHPQLFDSYRVFFLKIMTPGSFSLIDSAKINFNYFEVRLMEEPMEGEIYISDFTHWGLQDFAAVSPSVTSQLLTVYTNVFSIRLKRLIMINCPPAISAIVALLKQFLAPKLFARVQTSRDDSLIKGLFPDDYLPVDFGGSGPSMQEMIEAMKLKFLEHKDRFDLLDTLRVNEDLRPAALKNDDFLGYHGNFKKLTVD